MKKTTLTLILILASFLIGFIFFIQNYHTPSKKIEKANHFDGYMTHVHYLKTDANGRLEEELFTPRAEHYPAQKKMLYEHPILNLYPHTGGAWHIAGQHGLNAPGSDKVELWGKVTLNRDKSTNNPPMSAKTEAITALPHEHLVLTDKDVTIKQPGLTITGHGLRGNLDNGELKLLKNTQTEIDPQH